MSANLATEGSLGSYYNADAIGFPLLLINSFNDSLVCLFNPGSV